VNALSGAGQNPVCYRLSPSKFKDALNASAYPQKVSCQPCRLYRIPPQRGPEKALIVLCPLGISARLTAFAVSLS
jgi:hypothetical protein